MIRKWASRVRRAVAVHRLIQRLHRIVEFPVVVLFLLHDRGIHPGYAMTWPRRVKLAIRMYWNTHRVETLSNYKTHLAMAVKLLEIPPNVEGVVVECGCYLGGSTANLSLACEAAGRDLIVYDSFEGLPRPHSADKHAEIFPEGAYRAGLEQVKDNVRRLGALERCTFVKGLFAHTLPGQTDPVVLCFLDVDLQGSLNDCVLNLWPRLTQKGYVFIDEFQFMDYCALFYSERYWREHFDTTPPGLLGAGSGIGLGQYYLGPWSEVGQTSLQHPWSVAYTRRDFSGHWDFYPARE
jgi:O-methyltransferase